MCNKWHLDAITRQLSKILDIEKYGRTMASLILALNLGSLSRPRLSYGGTECSAPECVSPHKTCLTGAIFTTRGTCPDPDTSCLTTSNDYHPTLLEILHPRLYFPNLEHEIPWRRDDVEYGGSRCYRLPPCHKCSRVVGLSPRSYCSGPPSTTHETQKGPD